MLQKVFRDINICEIEAGASHVPQIIVEKSWKGYIRQSMWLEKPVLFKDPLDALCDLTVDIIHAYVRDAPGSLCLHTAAVQFNSGLFLFPSTYRSGKSILSMHLASKGVPVFTDDALPITPENDSAMVISLYPRLRLPLPDSVTADFLRFFDENKGESNHRYSFIQLNEELLPPYGTTAEIKGIVILQREEGASVELSEATMAETVKKMILRNFARRNPALDIVDRIYKIVGKSSCYKLIYDNLDEASDFLIERFNRREQGST